LHAKLLTIYTTQLPSAPPDANAPVDPTLDFFLLCDDSAEAVNGTSAEIPRLEGTSGCSIWEVRSLPEGEIWAPEKVLRVIGVSSAYLHKKYTRAKRWLAAAEILSRTEDPAVTAAVATVKARL
jgi:hypothetical protein